MQSGRETTQPVIIDGRFVVDQQPARQGGHARVYRALDLHAGGMPVAIKVFQPLRPTKEQVIRDIFQRELKVLNDVKDFTHVVRLIDWGTTSEWDGIEKPYAALEWVDGDLRDLLDEKPCEGWDDLAPMVIQILEGLSSIHQAGHAHRDIKPENVLVAQDGTLKIADFGISKAQTRMSQGVTFSGHGTVPYMPPEDYDGNFRLSRDVYAVAATVVVALGARVPASRDDLLAALDSLDLVPTVHAFWSRCLSSDPAERPASAEVALNQLRTIQKERAAHWVGQVDIYLSIAPPASDSVAARMSIDNADTGDFIVEDVGDKPTFARAERQTEALNGRDANDLYMYGNSFRYRLRPDEKQPVFIVIGAAKLPPSTLQTRSEEAWSGVVRIRRVSPLDLMQARADLTKLYEHVDEHERLAAERRTPARDRVTLRTWRQVLEFKRQVEANRGLPLRYRSFRLEGRRVIFDLMAEAGQDVIGQKRLVRGGRMRVLAGEVEDLAGNALSLFVETGTASNLPSSGQLEFDAEASKMAIARQVDAVDAVRFGRSVRTDLIDLLLHPESNRPPISVEIDRYYSSDLDVPKKAAIRSALGSSDIVLVEGPPGTGKTTFIAELVAQFLDRRPDARVLLSSQTHVALDNALDRLRQLRPELELVRLGPTAKIATEVEELRLEKRMEAWRDQIVVACRNFLGDFARQLGIMMPDTTTLDLAAELRQLTNALRDLRSTISVRQAERTALGAQADELQRHASTVLGTAERIEDAIRVGSHQALLDAAKRFVDQGVDLAARLERGSPLDQRVVELDVALAEGRDVLRERAARELAVRIELARILELEASPPPSNDDLLAQVDRIASPQNESFLKLQAIQVDWITRFGRNPEFNGALLARQHVVAATCVGLAGIRGVMEVDFDLCLVDEASKATATETLVPMSRASKWVLVGDQRQLPPFVEDNAITVELLAKYEVTKEQIEETLFGRLAEELPVHSKFVLSEQHRMLPAIGDLITHCFYPGLLRTRPREVPSYVQAAFGTPVLWLDTSKRPNRREEKHGSSRVNALEVRLACQTLGKLEFTANIFKVNLSVALLTGYLAQRDALHNAVEQLMAEWPHLTVNVSTVDAFQGREAAVCIFSLTRSNETGDLGFLEKRRVNVALSRGRDALVLIGDAEHVRRRGSTNNPLYEVLHYVTGSEGCTLEAATP